MKDFYEWLELASTMRSVSYASAVGFIVMCLILHFFGN